MRNSQVRRSRRFALGLALLFGALPLGARALPIVQNGGFETGDVAGWSCATSAAADCIASNSYANTGVYSVLVYENDGVGTLTQSLATTAGKTYDFSFYLAENVAPNPNSLFYAFDAGPAVAVASSLSIGTFRQVTDSFVAASDGTLLTFSFATEVGEGAFYIDDVSVTEVTSTVPLPAAAPLLAGGLALLAAAARRRRRA